MNTQPVNQWTPIKSILWVLFWFLFVVLSAIYAYAGPPSRVAWENWSAKSNNWAHIQMLVHCWQTNFPPDWWGAHWENGTVPPNLKGGQLQLALVNVPYQIVANHILTEADLPPRPVWPVIGVVAGTTNVNCEYRFDNLGPARYFFIESRLHP